MGRRRFGWDKCGQRRVDMQCCQKVESHRCQPQLVRPTKRFFCCSFTCFLALFTFLASCASFPASLLLLPLLASLALLLLLILLALLTWLRLLCFLHALYCLRQKTMLVYSSYRLGTCLQGGGIVNTFRNHTTQNTVYIHKPSL